MYHKRKHWLTDVGKRSLACFVALCMLFSFAPTVFSEGIELTEEVITDMGDVVAFQDPIILGDTLPTP